MIASSLVLRVRQHYQLDWLGVHGVRHWARVRVNGLALCRSTGADARVVELFAFLHDVGRLVDAADPLHGQRAADFIRALPRSLIPLDDERLAWLLFGVEHHTKGKCPPNATVATCWDADRLDLGRISVRPDKALLFSSAAKDDAFIEGCWRRARCRHPIPESDKEVPAAGSPRVLGHSKMTTAASPPSRNSIASPSKTLNMQPVLTPK